ncbi:3,4-dihydroxy-2-butanone-4-phosphate synthase [Natranaeroarchaeum aerophilus]|uniref:3,4-dihydroxy-2-butanone 4-phosphate synthase n=1 Tax=Natranaeroarchaeum aerophilus TaxID=2917711 RepID=A0AAE3FQX8_9EURY|nr:3,4-dihydroxy-2-butanone-4-phosphate synthase [Natranaeroarchaeum aerophilus]MCL9813698.1 3,4-dihydroxy-2-butanone-4-phosphate synthase [Natranaeroarchaeum aerophilus]
MVDTTSNAEVADAPPVDPVEEAIAAFREGQPVCVHDFDDREGETDIIYPAGAVDVDAVEQLRNDAGGLVCVGLSGTVADAASLPFLSDAIDHPASETDHLAYGDRSSFSLTVNHRDTFTGITDEDRSLTITEVAEFAAAVENGSPLDAEDFASEFRAPGHVHLLRAADGLLDERQGHTELGIALAQAADQPPAAVVCEMLDDDTGRALSTAAAREYAATQGIPFVDGEGLVERLG